MLRFIKVTYVYDRKGEEIKEITKYINIDRIVSFNSNKALNCVYLKVEESQTGFFDGYLYTTYEIRDQETINRINKQLVLGEA